MQQSRTRLCVHTFRHSRNCPPARKKPRLIQGAQLCALTAGGYQAQNLAEQLFSQLAPSRLLLARRLRGLRWRSAFRFDSRAFRRSTNGTRANHSEAVGMGEPTYRACSSSSVPRADALRCKFWRGCCGGGACVRFVSRRMSSVSSWRRSLLLLLLLLLFAELEDEDEAESGVGGEVVC